MPIADFLSRAPPTARVLIAGFFLPFLPCARVRPSIHLRTYDLQCLYLSDEKLYS